MFNIDLSLLVAFKNVTDGKFVSVPPINTPKIKYRGVNKKRQKAFRGCH